MNTFHAFFRPCRIVRLIPLLFMFSATLASSALAEPDTRAAALLSALDLTQPGLAPVKEALQNGGQDAALKAFADYLRNRTNVHWRENLDGSGKHPLRFDATAAAAAVEGREQGGIIPPVYAFPDGKIDWHFNATTSAAQPPNTAGKESEVAFSNEWQWQLNRMSFWDDLAGAYAATGDEHYAQAFVGQMRSWISQCPVQDHADNGPGSAWRTIEAGIRMGGPWPDAFFTFLHSPSMRDDDLIAMVGSFLDHAHYLRAHQTNFNWVGMEMSGLYATGVLFPEFRDAAEWRTFAAARLAAEAKRSFLPDGAEAELSTGYQNVMLDNITHIVEIARWNGREGELPPEYISALENGYGWEEALLTPDRQVPKFNDSWDVSSTIFRRASTYFPNRDDFRWFATDGKEGTPPPWTSTFLNRSGFAVMRSGWERDANYSVFRLGPVGVGHQHQDGLDLLFWAYGREVVFGNTGGAYDASKWHSWAQSTFSHNCLIVDGLGQSRVSHGGDPMLDPNLASQGPIDAQWQSNPVFDTASGIYDQDYGANHLRPAVQKRQVLFKKTDLFIVADRLTPNDASSHQYQARWQLLTTRTRLDSVTHVLVTNDPGMPNLAIVPLLVENLDVAAASAQEKPEILGWYMRHDKAPQNIPATTLLHTRSGAGPQLFLTLFVPLHPGQANPVAKVEVGSDGSSATAYFIDGRRLQISDTDSQGIEASETLSDGSAGRTNRTPSP